jgi:hypothetical protein
MTDEGNGSLAPGNIGRHLRLAFHGIRVRLADKAQELTDLG